MIGFTIGLILGIFAGIFGVTLYMDWKIYKMEDW